jgi:hypothetical protein
MWRRIKIFDKHNLKVSIISCGDTGEKIGTGIIRELKGRGTSIRSLLITSGVIRKDQKKVFSDVISIDPNVDGFAKNLDNAMEAAKDTSERFLNKLKNVIPSTQEELFLITTGLGATGVSGTLTVLDLLYKEYKMIPPVLTILPEVFENSRVQYIAALFLYDLLYKPNARRNPVLLLDNKPSVSELDEAFSDVAKKRIDTIPLAIADLLHGSFVETVTPEFDANVVDLYHVFHTPGISAFVVEDLETETGTSTARLGDVIADSVVANTSLSKDKIFESKASFILVTDIDPDLETLSFQTDFEARKLIKDFTTSRPFIKFIENDGDERIIPKVYAIIAGLPLPPRILQIMKIARDARKDIIIEEDKLMKETYEFNMDLINEKEAELSALFKD